MIWRVLSYQDYKTMFNHSVVRNLNFDNPPTLQGSSVNSHRWNLWKKRKPAMTTDPERVERDYNQIK